LQALIAGGGAIGSKLAVFLSQRGDDVTVIDEDRTKCEWLSKNSDAKVYNGNLLNPELLMEAGIDKVDAFIVALGNDQLTRKVVDFVKSQFGVPKVVAIAKESEELDQIRASGADTVVCSQEEVLKEVENLLLPSNAKTVYQDREGECIISKVTVRATSKAIGKSPTKLGDKLARISGIVRNRNFFFPDEETTLEMGDEVFMIGKQTNVEKLVDWINEET
jgi:trk system potassium uptake protein TrkA